MNIQIALTKNLGKRNGKCAVLFFFIFFTYQPIFSQGGDDSFTNINSIMNYATFPPSPEAVAFNKYGEYSVDLSHGIPEIKIPIYNIKYHDIELPIYLSYHSAGFKVSEESSWIGLGWTLHGGGFISRTIKGLNDYSNVGYSVYHSMLPQIIDGTLDFLRDQAANGNVDLQPDIYNYNVSGYSGQFYVLDDSAYLIPSNQDIWIERSIATADGNNDEWTIHTPDGMKYIFGGTIGEIGYTHSLNGCIGGGDESINDFASEYYLGMIVSPKGSVVSFDYDLFNISSQIYQSKTHQFIINELGNQTEQEWLHCLSTMQRTAGVLTSIDFNIGMVTLSATHSRQDLISDNAKALTNLQVTDEYGEIVKSIDFYQSYFGSTEHTYKCRLKLDSIKEIISGSTNKPTFKFNYNSSTPIPDKTSNGQDFWGFYNGAPDNQSQIPSSNNSQYFHSEGNRIPNGDYMDFGIINKITYPTGGETDFYFEPNTVSVTKPTSEFLTVLVEADCDNSDTIVSQEITLGADESQTVSINYTRNMEIGNFVYCWIKRIYENGGETVHWSGSNYGNNNENVYLIGGFTYSIQVLVVCEFYDEYTQAKIQFDYFKNNGEELVNEISGGLRIAKIVSTPINGNVLTKQYLYQKSINDIKSSGFLVCGSVHPSLDPAPYYESMHIRSDGNFYLNSDGVLVCGYTDPDKVVVERTTSDNVFSNGTVGYTEVIVKSIGDENIGYTIHKFSKVVDPYIKYNSPTDYSFLRGLQLKTEKYDSLDYSMELSESIYSTNVLEYKNIIDGYVIRYYRKDGCNVQDNHMYQVWPNHMISQWVRPETISKQTFYAGNELVENTTYMYSNDEKHHNPIKISTVNSQGQLLDNLFKYPQDYEDILTTNDMNALSIIKMRDAHIYNKPIESLTLANGQCVGGKLDIYSFNNSNDHLSIRPKKSYSLKLAVPEEVSLSHFNNNQLIFSEYYGEPDVEVDVYDNKNNIAQYHLKNNFNVSLLWAYNSTFPVSKIENAAYNQVAYSGFEQTITANGTSSQLLGNWRIMGGPSWYRASQSKAGKFALGTTSGGSQVKTENLLEPGKYMVTLWSTTSSITFQPQPIWSSNTQSVDTWYFHEAEIELTTPQEITVSINGIIDELRLYPTESNITTYSYDSFGNVLTKNDNNNIMQHYEYDGFGRLIIARDNDGNIIQQFNYNFATGDE